MIMSNMCIRTLIGLEGLYVEESLRMRPAKGMIQIFLPKVDATHSLHYVGSTQ